MSLNHSTLGNRSLRGGKGPQRSAVCGGRSRTCFPVDGAPPNAIFSSTFEATRFG